MLSILTSASSSSVSRGYGYYKNKKVHDINQLNDYEFEGYVDGSTKEPYYVKINIEHPRKSYCDCPHANGNITCKHMTALYFEIFPDEADDYESWLNSDYDDYEEEYDDYYYGNDYDDYEDDDYYEYRSNGSFEEPLFFDTVLENFIENLNTNQLKQILLEELKKDKKRTYELYLKKNYKQYLKTNNEEYVLLDKLNKKVQDLTGYYSYDYNDFNKEILNVREKQKIERLYQNKTFKTQIDKILLNEKLSVYSDYRWIASFYKKNKTEQEITEFSDILNNYLGNLKHYSIKNTVPKSNVLIAIYNLNNYTIEEQAQSLLKNAKYLQYIEYVIENSKDVLKLYREFIKLIEKNYFKNKMYIPEVLYRFAWITDYQNKEINSSHYLYSYLCLGKTDYLNILSYDHSEEEIIDLIENKTKDTSLLIKLYKYYNKEEKLWNILSNSKYQYLLLDNIELLENKYNDELYKHFIKQFYNILKEGKNRETYHKASKYIKAISMLNNGKTLVEEIVKKLKTSDYQKCIALFDEVEKVLEK